MRNKIGTIIFIIATVLFIITTTGLAVFAYPWKTTLYYYEDVDFEWDDDRNRYDICIEELGHFYISTQKTNYVYAPDDATLNVAYIEKKETIFNQFIRYDLVEFYINIGWNGEE